MKKHNLAFIDLETTGFDPEKHEIIEIGCVIVRQVPKAGHGPTLEVIDELEIKVKPQHIETADPEALQVNGYNSFDWVFAIELDQALKLLAEKAENANIVGLNVAFDWKFLEHAYKQTKVPYKFHYHRIEVMSMALAKLYHDERAQWFSLKALSEYFNIKNENAHTALADTKTTFEIYKKLIEK